MALSMRGRSGTAHAAGTEIHVADFGNCPSGLWGRPTNVSEASTRALWAGSRPSGRNWASAAARMAFVLLVGPMTPAVEDAQSGRGEARGDGQET